MKSNDNSSVIVRSATLNFGGAHSQSGMQCAFIHLKFDGLFVQYSPMVHVFSSVALFGAPNVLYPPRSLKLPSKEGSFQRGLMLSSLFSSVGLK